MRGLHPHKIWPDTGFGITPAHAGLTIYEALRLAGVRDHPRACGAYTCYTTEYLIHLGSPPRMRGLLHTLVQHRIIRGITPAHAGLTVLCRLCRHLTGDHPRACGAYRLNKLRSIICKGSPPRMRGLLSKYGIEAAKQGITPAHAGLTCSVLPAEIACRDHPRACGAYNVHDCNGAAGMGSPPRMRGLPVYASCGSFSLGITPAHAGLTH